MHFRYVYRVAWGLRKSNIMDYSETSRNLQTLFESISNALQTGGVDQASKLLVAHIEELLEYGDWQAVHALLPFFLPVCVMKTRTSVTSKGWSTPKPGCCTRRQICWNAPAFPT